MVYFSFDIYKQFIEEMDLKMYVCRKSDPESKGAYINLKLHHFINWKVHHFEILFPM